MASIASFVKDYPPNLDGLLDFIVKSDKDKVVFRDMQKDISVTDVWRIKSWMKGGGSLAESRLLHRTLSVHSGEKGKNEKKYLVIKYDHSYRRNKLVREINWLLNLDKCVSYLFPEIIYYSLNKKCPFYIAPHYGEYTALSDLFLYKKISDKIADKILNELLNLMFSKIYPKKASKECKGYIQKFHINRIKKRHKETIFYCKSFKELINERKININGVTYENAPKIVTQLENNKTAIGRLSPGVLNMVHGDLHFGNVLFSDSQEPDLN